MCLGIPVKLVKKDKNKGFVKTGKKLEEVNLELVDAKVGDYVITQAGLAVQKLDKKEAQKTLSLLGKLLTKVL